MWLSIVQIADYIFLGVGILAVLFSILFTLGGEEEAVKLTGIIGIGLLLVAIAIKLILL